MWCIPPTASADFVYHMEDVLDMYHRPSDLQHPVVCLDEATKQLIGEVREPLPARPGEVRTVRLRIRPQRHGYSVRRRRSLRAQAKITARIMARGEIV